MSAYKVGQDQMKNWLECYKKTSSEILLESALECAHEWKVQNTQIRVTDDNDGIVADVEVSVKRVQLIVTENAMLRVMLKLKLRMILACDSAHEVLWNSCSFHVLGVIDCFRTFWPIF